MKHWQPYRDTKQGTYLIRFVSKKHLFQFLKTGNIWFSRADVFGDRMECVTIDDLSKKPFDKAALIERQKRHLISCWHNESKESIAMWDASYKDPSKRRVYAIKFNSEALIDYATGHDFEVDTSSNLYGNVRYKNLLRRESRSNVIRWNPDDRVRYAAFRKEYAFGYEKEFRFVAKSKTPFSEKGYALNLGQPDDLSFEIMINPLLNKTGYQKCENELIENPIGRMKYSQSALFEWLKPLEWD